MHRGGGGRLHPFHSQALEGPRWCRRELHDVLNFVRSGGLILAQRKKAVENGRLTAEEASARRTPTTIQASTGFEAQRMMAMGMAESPGLLSRGVGDLALALVRWGARWAWRASRAIADAREP